VRAVDGAPVLAFQPVAAYEQNHPLRAVRGEYRIQPGATPDTWTISLRTPWSWWVDAQRNYPAVLDPTMKVLKSTGYADGMAWVRGTGAQDYTLGGIRLGAHLHDWNTETRGYVQFNSLPALLSNSSPKSDYSPIWSPDGQKILFLSDRDGNLEIYVVNEDGKGIKNLTKNKATDYNPVWSPDGSQIVFTSERDGNPELYVMNSDGTGVTRLTSQPGNDYSNAWICAGK